MPVSNVNLVANPQPQSVDYQAQLLQQAQAAELAKALIASGMSPESPIIHTGGSNPFARDVVNLAPLGKMAQAYFCGKMRNEANSSTQEIANAMLQRQMSEGQVIGDALTSGGPNAAVDAYRRTLTATSPRAQATGDAIIKAIVESSLKQTPTGGDILGSGANLKPDSVAASIRTGPMGLGIQVDPSQLQLKDVINELRPGNELTRTNVNDNIPSSQGVRVPGSVIQGGFRTGPPAVPRGETVAVARNTPAPGPILMPNTPGNPTSGVMTRSTITGQPSVLAEAPETEVATSEAKGHQKYLQETADMLREHAGDISKIPQIVALASRAQLGITAPIRDAIRRLALDMGVTEDQLARIPATQSLSALMLPFTTEKSRALNPRAAQQVIQMMSEATASNKDVDPRHVVDIAGNLLTDYLNNVKTFNERTIPAYSKGALGSGADKYKVDFDPAKMGLPADSPIRLEQTPGGYWINKGLSEPRGVGEATSLKGGKHPDFSGMTKEQVIQYLQGLQSGGSSP